MCHHVASVITMILLLTRQECVVVFVAALGLAEVSNPLLQVRWFIKKLNVRSTAVPLLIDTSFTALFFICRFIFMPYLSFYLLFDSKVRLLMKLLNILFTAVSVIFMFQIICVAKKSLKRHQKASL